MMPTKTKSSTAAKSKAKSHAHRPARGGASTKAKSAASKKSAPARAAKRVSTAATKPRAATKPAIKPAAKSAAKPAARSTAKPVTRLSNRAAAAAPAPAARKAKPASSASRPAPVAGATGSNVRHLARQVAGIAPYEETQGEEYMGEPQREHFRKILLQWKRELMVEVDRTVHHMQDEAANFPDPNDRATQESEFSLELRARDRERKLIKKIDEALASVNSGDYGYCESCGVEIGIRRLEARPTATLCIDCKTLDEIREKQTGS
jgi:DnaK suppressor protein